MTDSEVSKRWRAANPEKAKAAGARWRLANPEPYRALLKAWRERNRAKRAEHQAKRRARERGNVKWADHSVIDDLYSLAKIYREHGVLAEVDHVVPLCGRNVSGLHVHTNLQCILKSENQSKHNRFQEA